MSEHTHTKVYSGEYFATLVPKWAWICADCHASGTDPIPQHTPPPLDMPRYLDLLAVNDPAAAASLRRTMEKVAQRKLAKRSQEHLSDTEMLDIILEPRPK